MPKKVKDFFAAVGLPRIIIVSFFLVLMISAATLRMDIPVMIGDVIRRWAMYGVLVLAMVPGVQCGIGLNFGVTLGIAAGLVGALTAIDMNFSSPVTSILFAVALGAVIASVFGYLYGLLLNKVKGSEMTVSTYVGFSVVALMNIMWLVLPFKAPASIWPVGGSGLRNTISLADSFGEVLNNFLGFYIGPSPKGGIGIYRTVENASGYTYIPTGLILFFFLVCLIVWLFLRSKTGMAMSAAGANPAYAKAAGINVNKMRVLGTTVSTALGAVGIICYAQSFGFLQLYNAPLMMGFACVAAVLIGGASVGRASISHVIIGTFLFQGILTVALPVANQIIPEGNLSDVVRIIISNGIILYALTKTGGGKARE